MTYFDAAQIEHPIRVRGFNPGDRFQPFGLSGSQKLKKLFIDRKDSGTFKVALANHRVQWKDLVGGRVASL